MFNTPTMSNTPNRSSRIALLIALGMLIGPACANQPVSARTDGLTVERLSSSDYDFSRVRVEPDVDSISISGEVARVIPHRGMIPGKVVISLIGADGQLLEQAEVKPMRRNRQDQSAHFYARFETSATAGSRLLIEHSGG
jgi:hypothetical protein